MDFQTDLRLQDHRVLLRRFRATDLQELAPVAFDVDIWRFTPNRISTWQELETWGQQVVQGYATGSRYTFLIVDRATGQLAGSTSYGNISEPDKRLEIGWTWLGKDFRGSGLNRHCKFLLLQHAFETLQMERVELKTDALNLRSRRAMLKLGAVEEGILRSHTHMHDGRRRDTIYYSILRQEWAGIKERVFPDLAAHPA
ncbi:GNAT family N-acetyltransferase [Pontibacter mangrovi]|uniref:GNAT family N-acetyltransferase n=1 Tax=Pontibacter mangrovi TaxID=2589816 RepID=A0A501W3N2_9BACT|nr:GNAT family N-acetyltransferase [Pontibacter mangrovi]